MKKEGGVNLGRDFHFEVSVSEADRDLLSPIHEVIANSGFLQKRARALRS